MSIAIHLGAHKTATTHLQNGLAAIRHPAARAGLWIMAAPGTRRPPTDLHVVLSRGDPALIRDCGAALRHRASRQPNALITEELILGGVAPQALLGAQGRLYPRARARVALLTRMLGARDVTLYLAIRRGDDFLASVYGENLRAGRMVQMAQLTERCQPEALRWTDLAQRLLAAPGIAKLICWRHEDFAALRPDILTRMVGADLAAQVPDQGRQRPGLSDQAHRLIMAALPDTPPDQRRARINQIIADHPKGPDAPAFAPWPPETRAATDAAYAADCADLAALPGATLLRPPA